MAGDNIIIHCPSKHDTTRLWFNPSYRTMTMHGNKIHHVTKQCSKEQHSMKKKKKNSLIISTELTVNFGKCEIPSDFPYTAANKNIQHNSDYQNYLFTLCMNDRITTHKWIKVLEITVTHYSGRASWRLHTHKPSDYLQTAELSIYKGLPASKTQ